VRTNHLPDQNAVLFKNAQPQQDRYCQ